SDSIHQQAALDSLKEGIFRFQSISDSLIKLVRAGQSADMIRTEFLNNSALRTDLTLKIDRIKDVEKIQLAQREFTNRESVKEFRSMFIFLLAGIVVLLAATFFSVRYNFNKRQKAQEELTRANELFEKIFYESPIALIISELGTGRILNCNKVFASTVNYGRSECLGRTAVELGIFETNESQQRIFEGTEKKGTSRHAEMYINPRDKEPIYISIHAHIIPLYDNHKCLLTAMLDLSMHKKAEDEIKRALETEIELNKLKSNFVTLASHEFRTPLTTILSSAFLLENYMHAEKQQEAGKHLRRIKTSVNNLTSILDEFLSITKIEEGNVQPNLERTDLPKCIATICNNLQTFAKPGQVIHYSHSGNTEATTDPVLLGNILTNLISNSIKYSGDNSTIHVTSTVNERVHLTVKDQGIGISEADQKHLFERFFRATNAGTIQGTGLGLHIMKHYVQMLKGSVELKSELGKGTQVNVTL
ncbi:MAG TPA: PAS domain-containing sensor histidine kinase, partial [Cyclobacteriaceae bacterium]|nr:PAS domain-containing sensor histidine kinase [Cyclobacteriaceae bacterium]